MAFLNFDIELEEPDKEFFMDVVREPLRKAVDKGMHTLVEKGVMAVIARWKHGTSFGIEVDQDNDSVTATAYTSDKIYQWVDEGTGPYSFSVVKPRMMKFPFQGRGISYSAKTDGGSGDRLGSPIRTRTVNNRGIEARDISGKALSEHLDGGETVWIVIEQALGG